MYNRSISYKVLFESRLYINDDIINFKLIRYYGTSRIYNWSMPYEKSM